MVSTALIIRFDSSRFSPTVSYSSLKTGFLVFLLLLLLLERSQRPRLGFSSNLRRPSIAFYHSHYIHPHHSEPGRCKRWRPTLMMMMVMMETPEPRLVWVCGYVCGCVCVCVYVSIFARRCLVSVSADCRATEHCSPHHTAAFSHGRMQEALVAPAGAVVLHLCRWVAACMSTLCAGLLGCESSPPPCTPPPPSSS